MVDPPAGGVIRMLPAAAGSDPVPVEAFVQPEPMQSPPPALACGVKSGAPLVQFEPLQPPPGSAIAGANVATTNASVKISFMKFSS